MTRDYNSSNNSRNNNNRNPRHSDNNRKPNRPHHGGHNNKKHYNKSNIMLKSTVYALGMVLVVLVIAFLIIKKSNKGSSIRSMVSQKCTKDARLIKIDAQIDQVIVGNKEIIALTKSHNGTQEIIRLDKKCLNELSRNKFVK